MENIKNAFRNIFKKGQHNVMKITSLAIGLALGLVLIAKVSFEQSYDSFYKDSDRIYRVTELVPDNDDEELQEHPYTAGGVPVYMRMNIPEIETATRFTWLGSGATFSMTDTKDKIKADYAVADSCLFDVLDRPVIQGNPKKVLGTPLNVMISESVAKRIGPDAVGRTITLDGRENAVLTIGGIFKDFPENSEFDIEMFVSMPSISYYTWDGSMNLIGNDRYVSLVKLKKGTEIEAVESQVEKLINEYFPVDELEKAGIEFGLGLRRLSSMHSEDENVKNMVLMLTLIALALLFTAAMNYILLVVSSIIGRSRETAVRKCYGATDRDIYGIILSEAAVHTLIALILAVVLLFAFQGTVEKLTGTSLGSLLRTGIWILAGTCAAMVVITGMVPGTVFSKIPVATAFRSFRESKRIWKLTLLSIQFAAAAFLIILLAVVSRQYSKMANDKPGYEYQDLAYMDIFPVGDISQRKLIMEELRKMPEIKEVSYANTLPMHGTGGDNVMLPGDSRELFNCADLYCVGDRYFDVLEIPVIAGEVFNPDMNTAEQIMVSRKFVQYMEKTAGWDENVVGKQICVTSFNDGGRAQTICGVYENFRLGAIMYEDDRPSVMFFNPDPAGQVYLLIRFHKISPEAIAKAEAIVSSIVPDKDLHVYSYKNDMTGMYAGTRNFRDSITIGGIVTLLIVFIGLVGYTTDEVNRRRKEIAVRKINGATMSDIEKMLTGDVVKIAVPATVAGAAMAYWTSVKWLEQFSEKTGLPWYIFAGGMVAVIAVCIIVAGYNVLRISGSNPAEALKSE